MLLSRGGSAAHGQSIITLSVGVPDACVVWLVWFHFVASGGVGFDINCGVRLLRTNLSEKDVAPLKEDLAQVLC